jgi:uncharacterized membrane protein YGL010W
MTKKLEGYFKDYASYHKTPGNKTTHYFGITFIVVSLLGLLSHWVIGSEGLTGSLYFRLDGGTLLMLLAMAWYISLDWRIAFPFAGVLFGLYFLGRTLPSEVNWLLFVAGWILQGIGHYVYEKKSPAFFTNLRHILIGPLWIFVRLIGY